MNPPFGLTQMQLVMIVIVAIVIALLGFFGGRAYVLKRRDARRVARVTSGAADFLRNVLVPDGNGGDFHLDFVLLTSRGVVIIDMRDIAGNVFGGDQMTDWTLMDGPRRRTFVNPQSGLYDRIASVKAIANDVPVDGRIVFTRRARRCSIVSTLRAPRLEVRSGTISVRSNTKSRGSTNSLWAPLSRPPPIGKTTCLRIIGKQSCFLPSKPSLQI